jgi:hypothetical protein
MRESVAPLGRFGVTTAADHANPEAQIVADHRQIDSHDVDRLGRTVGIAVGADRDLKSDSEFGGDLKALTGPRRGTSGSVA